MEKAKDEEYYLLIPNPITDNEEEFDLNRQTNVGLAMRLIRKRENIMKSMRSNFNKLERVRDQKNVDQLEEKTQEALREIDQVSLDDFENEEEYEERFNELEKKVKSLRDQYPDEVINLQNEISNQMAEMDRVGVKICTVILNPVDGVPPQYPSKKDYIEELIGSDQDIQDVISFFLSTLNSTTMSRKEKGIQMKKKSERKKEG